MIKKVFIDTDIFLDVATAREPFVDASKAVLSIVEAGFAMGVMSSNSVTNLYYILRKLGSHEKAKLFIGTILHYISVIPIDHENILRALGSEFSDFEDAVQYYCALKNGCHFLVTRNIRDYRFSELQVLEPPALIALYTV